MKIKNIAIIVLIASLMLTVFVGCSNPQVTLVSISATYLGEDIAIGDTLNNADIKVTATYSDKTTKQVTKFTVSSLDTTTKGDKKVTVTYTEGSITKTCELTITVVDSDGQPPITDTTAVGIEVVCSVDTVPHNSTLSDDALTVYVLFDDDSREELNSKQYSVVADFSKVGRAEITVTYNVDNKQLTDSVSVTVVKVLSGIRAEYTGGVALNEDFDNNKLTVYKLFSDNTEETITEGYEVVTDGFSSATTGEQQVTIKLTGSEYQFVLTVVVYDPAGPATITGIRAEYTGGEVDVGQQYDASLVKVYKLFSDDTEELVTESSEYQLGTLDSATEGTKQVKVTLQSYSTQFEVLVNDIATLYFYNYARWENVYAHYWKADDAELTVSTEWPGVAMTKESDSNWYYIVVDAECQKIIFHNNVSGYTIQTENLDIDYSKPYFAILDWSSEKSVDNIMVLDLSVSPWLTDSPRFAVNMWNSTTADPAVWLDLKGVAGENQDNVLNYKYYAVDTTNVTADKFILCRMNPATTENNWTNKWNQTIDLELAKGIYVKLSNNWEQGENAKATPEQQRAI